MEAGLSPQVIASRNDLLVLLNLEDNCALLRGWRKSLAGEPLQELVEGKRQVVVEQGTVKFQAP